MTNKNVSDKEMALVYPVLTASPDNWYFGGCMYERNRLLFGTEVLY